jgi:multisubunit Na+/H+ antiporter MnhB subunit
MNLAFLLPVKFREERFVYGEDFFVAGAACLVLALLLVLTTRALRKKKTERLSYWLWVLVGSGVAMIALAYVLDVTNPGVSAGYLG